MTTVNKTIQFSDYNNIRKKVIDVLGTGAGSYGYGQPIRSSAVAETSLISVTDWNNLAYDVINAYVHQVGSTPTLPVVTENTIVDTASSSVTFNASISGTTLDVKSVVSGMIADGQTIVSGAVAGTTITGKLVNAGTTISSLNTIAQETVSADYYSDVMQKVTYSIPTQVEAPAIDQYYTVSGNSNPRFNGTVKCIASTTNTISLAYNSNPENSVTATYATEVAIVAAQVFDASGTLTEAGPNRIFAGSNVIYMTANNFSLALTAGLTIGSGISGTGIPISTYITGTERLLIGSSYYNSLTLSKTITSTSGTATISVGSSGTILKVSSTLGIIPGMIISGGGTGGYLSSQTVVSVFADGKTLTTSAAPTGTPSGTLTFKNVYGTGVTTFIPGTTDRTADGNPWGQGRWTVTPSQTAAYTLMTATSNPNNYPFTYYASVADTLQTNRFNIASGQFITTNKGSKSETLATWNTNAYTTVTMSFSTAEKARFYFNSGSKITFTSSLSGGTSSQQYDKWVALLNSVSFTWGGSGFFSLTSTPAQVYISAASTPYTGNYIKISAYTPDVANNSNGTASTVAFLIEFIDGYVDPGPPAPGDAVNGTLSVYAATTEAYGFLVPAGAGNFTVESPTVTYGSILSNGVVASYLISTSSTSITEGQSAAFNLYTTAFTNGTLYLKHIGTYLNGTTTNVTISNNVGVYTVNALPQAGNQGSRTIQLEVRTGSQTGTLVATSSVVALSG